MQNVKTILAVKIEPWLLVLFSVTVICFIGGMWSRNIHMLNVTDILFLDWTAFLLMSSALAIHVLMTIYSRCRVCEKWWLLATILLSILATGVEAYSTGLGFENGKFLGSNPELVTMFGVEWSLLFYLLSMQVKNTQDG